MRHVLLSQHKYQRQTRQTRASKRTNRAGSVESREVLLQRLSVGFVVWSRTDLLQQLFELTNHLRACVTVGFGSTQMRAHTHTGRVTRTRTYAHARNTPRVPPSAAGNTRPRSAIAKRGSDNCVGVGKRNTVRVPAQHQKYANQQGLTFFCTTTETLCLA